MSEKTAIDKMLDAVAWQELPKREPGEIPHATHAGKLEILGHLFHVYQLSNGQRVFDAADIEAFFGFDIRCLQQEREWCQEMSEKFKATATTGKGQGEG